MIPTNLPVYTDFSQLAELKNSKATVGENLENVARQFESLFTHMMIKSMRQATPGDSLFSNSQMDTYQGMFDQQIAIAMSQGKGLGIAEAMLRQMAPSGSQVQTQPKPLIEGLPSGLKLPVSVDDSMPLAQPQLRPKAQANPNAVSATQREAVLKAYGVLPAPSTEYAMRNPLQAAGLNPAEVHTPQAPRETLNLAAVERHSRPGTPEDFIARVWPAAQRVAGELGVSPRVLIAQAALETGWGRHMPKGSDGQSSQNYFGIKTHNQWDGRQVAANTTEIVNGQAVREKASFRAYDSIEASFHDFADFLKTNPRYENALSVSHDAEKFVEALQKAGYATDPKYADKLKSIMNGRRMNLMVAQADAQNETTKVG